MSRSRTYKTEAIVLRQMPLGETDRILTLFTIDSGKVRAVGKGVRRTRSRLGGHLELLNRVSVSLGRGRDLDVVSEAQTLQTYRLLRDDLERLSKAIYVAELVDTFSVERSSSYSVYELLAETLGRLEETANPDLLLRHFEVRLLDLSGYRPELHNCVECRSELEPADHAFSCAAGGVRCPRCRGASGDPLIPISVNSMKVLRLLQREAQPSRVSGLRVSARVAGETERTLRTYIRFIVERELKSAEFMNLVTRGGHDGSFVSQRRRDEGKGAGDTGERSGPGGRP